MGQENVYPLRVAGADLMTGYAFTGHDFLDRVMANLRGKKHRRDALEVLWGLVRHVEYGNPECTFGKQEDLAMWLEMHPQQVSRGLGVLEQIGAITRIKDGNRKRVLITPQGVYRGKLQDHPKVVEGYQNVVRFPA